MPFGSATADYHATADYLPSTAGGIAQTAAEKRNLHLSNELLTLKRTLEEHQVQRLGKLPTIPFFAEFAPRHAAVHVRKAIETLLPVTNPARAGATPCLVAIGIASLLQECLSRLQALDIAVPLYSASVSPALSVVSAMLAPDDIDKKKDSIEHVYSGNAWTIKMVQDLHRKIDDKSKEMPYRDIRRWVVDTIRDERKWAVARVHLATLLEDSKKKKSGPIAILGRSYSQRQITETLPKLRRYHGRRIESILRTASHVFDVEGPKTTKKLLHVRTWRSSGGLRERAASAALRKSKPKTTEIRCAF
jgi:hypothetical protein